LHLLSHPQRSKPAEPKSDDGSQSASEASPQTDEACFAPSFRGSPTLRYSAPEMTSLSKLDTFAPSLVRQAEPMTTFASRWRHNGKTKSFASVVETADIRRGVCS
jgi:hypothetical protein